QEDRSGSHRRTTAARAGEDQRVGEAQPRPPEGVHPKVAGGSSRRGCEGDGALAREERREGDAVLPDLRRESTRREARRARRRLARGRSPHLQPAEGSVRLLPPIAEARLPRRPRPGDHARRKARRAKRPTDVRAVQPEEGRAGRGRVRSVAWAPAVALHGTPIPPPRFPSRSGVKTPSRRKPW